MSRSTNKFKTFVGLIGYEHYTTSHTEKLISVVGILFGLLAVYEVSDLYLPPDHSLLMVASMGATSLLLFGMPHAALSQPWPVLVSHLVAAAIGVTAHLLFPDYWWTAAVTVALAMGAMHYLHCIHPPAAATAMIAVIGGDGVYVLGYEYLLTPVLLNVTTLLLAAVIFNSFFPWRRYPARLAVRTASEPQLLKPAADREPKTADFEAALEELDSYRDISAQDLSNLYQRARYHAAARVAETAKPSEKTSA